jgi:hypothetical protein
VSEFLTRYGINISEEAIYQKLYGYDDASSLDWIRACVTQYGGVRQSILLELADTWRVIDDYSSKYARDFLRRLPKPSVLISDIELRVFFDRLGRYRMDVEAEQHIVMQVESWRHRILLKTYIDIINAANADPFDCVAVCYSRDEVLAAKSLRMPTVGYVGNAISPTWLAGVLLAAGVDTIACDFSSLEDVAFQSRLPAKEGLEYERGEAW